MRKGEPDERKREFVCVCVCSCTYVCVCVSAILLVCMHVCAPMSVWACVRWERVCVCVYECVCVRTPVHVCACMFVPMPAGRVCVPPLCDCTAVSINLDLKGSHHVCLSLLTHGSSIKDNTIIWIGQSLHWINRCVGKNRAIVCVAVDHH